MAKKTLPLMSQKKKPMLVDSKRARSKSSRSRTAAPAPKSNKSSRSYNAASRQVASQKSREAIVQALVKLLVARKGGDVSIAEISKASKISERTIFRFFHDKTELMKATSEYIASFLADSGKRLAEEKLDHFVNRTFQAFDQSADFTMAYLFSSFGQQARPLFRKKLNPALRAKIMAENPVQTPTRSDGKIKDQTDARLALIVSLINARVWYEMKSDFGYSGAESGAVVSWAIRSLIKNLKDN